jgi:hypothetical protein
MDYTEFKKQNAPGPRPPVQSKNLQPLPNGKPSLPNKKPPIDPSMGNAIRRRLKGMQKNLTPTTKS